MVVRCSIYQPLLQDSALLIFFRVKQMKTCACSRRNGDCNIKGLLANRSSPRKSRRTVFLVNDRFIKSGYLHHAVMAAYEGILRMVHNQVIFIFNRAAKYD
jgi:DNA mismatch repair ATPase MutL